MGWFQICLTLILVCLLPALGWSPDFRKGMSYTSFEGASFSTRASQESLKILKDDGVEWIAVIVTWYQKSVNATTIAPTTNVSPTDADVEAAITTCRTLGMKVMLKPHVDCDDGQWRGMIGQSFTSQLWTQWFQAYTAFITHFADIAQKYTDTVQLFCAGVEYLTPSKQEASWRAVIASIRQHYTGKVTYAANWGSEIDELKWGDVLDVIGIDAYYSLSKSKVPSYSDLVSGWAPTVLHLAGISQQWKKTIIFPEIGFKSIDGTAISPGEWNVDGALNVTQQLDCYRATFEAFKNQDWWSGIFWWNWESNPYDGGLCDENYTPRGKPAEALVKQYYTGKETSFEPFHYQYQHSSKRQNALVIYQNGNVAADWGHFDWGGTTDLRNTEHLYTGEQYSAKSDVTNWGGLAFNKDNFDTSPYNYAEFLVYGSPSLGNDLRIGAVNQKDGSYIFVTVSSYSNCSIPIAWTKVQVPLTNFLADHTTIKSINFQVGHSGQATYWIDKLVLTN